MGAFNGMKKGVLASAIGATGAVAAVTGAYGLGMFESAEEQVDRPALSGEYDDGGINKDSFRKQPPKDCIKNTFPGIETGLEQLKGYEKYEDSNKDQLNKDPQLNFSKDKSSNGCLTVVGDRSEPRQKTDDNRNKFSGSFSLLGSFSQEDKGFITYSQITFEKDEHDKATWTSGGIYALERQNNNGWQIISQYEGGKSNHSKIPKPGETLSSIKDLNFWGLEGESVDASAGAIRKQTQGGSYGRGTGKNKGESEITSGSSNLNDGWEELFGDCKNKVLDKVKGITGKGEQVAIEGDKPLGSGGR